MDGRQPQKHGKPLLISFRVRNPWPQPAPPSTSFPDKYHQAGQPGQVLFAALCADAPPLTAKPQFSAGFRYRDKRDKRDNTIVLSRCPDVPASRCPTVPAQFPCPVFPLSVPAQFPDEKIIREFWLRRHLIAAMTYGLRRHSFALGGV